MKKLLKQVKGITLVALIITVILILILAGVAISVLTKDKGIFEKSKVSSNESKISQIQEYAEILKNKRNLDMLTDKTLVELTVEEFSEILIEENIVKEEQISLGIVTIGTSTIDIKDYLPSSPKTIIDFEYKPETQTFRVERSGIYKVELWGASGGFPEGRSECRGGYVSGEIYLKSGTELFIYTGEAGSISNEETYNGGGRGGNGTKLGYGYSGGGATDIRLVDLNESNEFESLKSRIIVAAGGGGGAGLSGGTAIYYSAGYKSAAGGLNGYAGNYYSGHGNLNSHGKGGTNVTGGAKGSNIYSASGTAYSGTFGKGGNSLNTSSGMGAGGGGAGYFGGGAGGATGSGGSGNGAGGGSSYISGHEGCIAIDETATSENIIMKTISEHYSGYIFSNTCMIDGLLNSWTTVVGAKQDMPEPDGTFNTTTGHTGNGHVKITYIGAR